MRRALALGTLLVLVLTYPAAALSVTQTIPVGAQPYGVALTPDGRLYVANNGSNTISVVDPATANAYTVSPTITVGRGPGEIAIDPVADRAYVSNYNDSTVSVIDIAAGSVIATISPGGLGVAVDPGLGRLYIAYGTELVVVDTASLQQVATIPAPAGSSYFGIAVDPSRHLGYIGDLGASAGGVVVVDLRTNSVLTTVDVGGRVRFALTTDPARGRVLVATDSFGSTFSVIDSNSSTVVASAPLPLEIPSHIAVSSTDRAYVTENDQAGNADLAAVDLATSTVTRYPINAQSSNGPRPSGLALVGPKIYTALNGSNVLAVLANAAPVVDSVTVSPSSPRTNDTLTASVSAHDADGDALTYSYQWTRNGSDISGATAATLDLSTPGNGDRGDSIAVRVTASDGSLTSAPVTSAPVVVADTAPVVSVSLNTTAPTTRTVLTATVAATDADGDALTFTYVWKVNGAIRRTTVTSATSDGFDLGKPGNGNKDDVITVDVTASDGSLGATATATATVTAGHP